MNGGVRDVVVVGGGPGGSACATFLARAGLGVVLLEKERFPRFRIGESLLPYGNDVLRDLGVWDKLCAAGFIPKYGAEFCSGDRARTQRFWFGRNLAPRYEHAFQVERARFDQLLLDHARDAGVEVMEGTAVGRITPGADGTVTVNATGDGGAAEWRARWVVDASGRDAAGAVSMGWRKRQTLPARRVALYAHFRGVFRNSGKAAGHITIVRLRDGWTWLIPLDDEKTSVGLVVPVAAFRAAGGDAEAVWADAVTGCPELEARLRGAERLGPLRTTGDYSWRFDEFARDRVVLVGDAAGFVDPIFSSGVMLALKSAQRAAELIAVAHRAGRGLQPAECAGYTREVARWMRVYARMIRAFYDNAGFEVFMNPAPVLEMPRAVAHVVGGDTELSLALRLRLAAFYGLCRVQRFMRIAPRIPLMGLGR